MSNLAVCQVDFLQMSFSTEMSFMLPLPPPPMEKKYLFNDIPEVFQTNISMRDKTETPAAPPESLSAR